MSYGTLTYVSAEQSVPLPGGYRYDNIGRAHWHVDAQPQVMSIAKRLFPRARQGRGGAITLSDTPEVARNLSQMLLSRYAFDIDKAAAVRLHDRMAEHIRTEADVASILKGGSHIGLPDGAYTPTIEPWEAQKVGAALAHRTRRLLLLDETGAGKTLTACLSMVTPDTLPATVVGPPHLLLQWKREIARFYPMVRTHIVQSGSWYDPATKREMAGYQPDVLLITYGMLRGWADHLREHNRCAVFEECHELRVGNSQKYDAANVLAGAADLVIGVSATPVFNYGDEIHHIAEVVAPDVLGTEEEFKREWCHPVGNGKWKVNDPKALGFYLRSEGVVLKRTLKEMGIEIPGARPIIHAIDVDAKAFDRMADEAVDMAETIVTREAKPFELMRATRDFDAAIRRATGVAKAGQVATFCRMLLDSCERLMLFGWHRDVYTIWLENLKDFNPVMYTGSESQSMKEISKARFMGGDHIGRAYDLAEKNRGWEAASKLDWSESRVMVISLRSGSGMDGIQHHCHTAVQGELDWSYGPHHQGVGRLDRPGQQHQVLNYWLVSDYGTDPGMLETIDIKRQQAEGIVDPDRDVFEPTQADPDRIRKLAAEFLRKRQPGTALPSDSALFDTEAAA